MHATILQAGDLFLEIYPSLGGAVTRFTSGEFPIFRQTPEKPASVSDCASFPLIPFSNRIRNGRFSFAGAAFQIPLDKRDPRFTNHGHTRHHPWQVAASTPTDLTLRFSQPEPTPSWPFPFTAEQEFNLSPGRLTMRARIRNDHTMPAPAGIGFHPYFTRLPDTALGFAADCIWETDELDIPVRSAPPVGRFGFTPGKAIEAPLINHAYGGWNGTAEIIHPSRLRVLINATAELNHLILFTPAGKNFFGFEPVSHRPDALNPLADERDQGITILSPGESLEGRMDITVVKTS
jgi:aldose 1-epimerase